jgi:Zn-dependent protease
MGKPPHFRLLGIPVRVEPVFFVIIGVFGLSYASVKPILLATWVLIAFVSVLVHELGHAVAFKAFGVQPSVVLYGMGGLTSGSGRLTPGRNIVVSLAGPLSTLVLFGLPAVWLIASGAVPGGDGQVVLEQVVFINVGWAVLNLLPILPLDGGNVLAAVLDAVTGGRGRRPAAIVSIVLAAGVALWGFLAGWFFVGMLGVMFAGMNVAGLSQDQRADLDEDLAEAHRALVAQQPHLAERHARDVLARRPSGPTAVWAHELLGWSRLWQGDLAGARAAIADAEPPPAARPVGALAGAPLPAPTPRASRAFDGALAMVEGRRDEGLAVLTWSVANEQPGPSQLLGVIAAARLELSDQLVRELVLLGPDRGMAAGKLVVQLLDYAGFAAEAARAANLVSTVPPAWPAVPGPAAPGAAVPGPATSGSPASGSGSTTGRWLLEPPPGPPTGPPTGPARPAAPGWTAPDAPPERDRGASPW